MLKHVAWQMRNVWGGLDNILEDWVERLHQTGMHLQQCICTVQNLAIHANAREKASSLSLHPNVITPTNATNAGNKRSFSVAKVDDTILTRQKKQHDMVRYEAMKYFKKEVKMNKLTWLVLTFDNVKGGRRGRSARAQQCCAILIKKWEGTFWENIDDT
jgi:hypothetical protein